MSSKLKARFGHGHVDSFGRSHRFSQDVDSSLGSLLLRVIMSSYSYGAPSTLLCSMAVNPTGRLICSLIGLACNLSGISPFSAPKKPGGGTGWIADDTTMRQVELSYIVPVALVQ